MGTINLSARQEALLGVVDKEVFAGDEVVPLEKLLKRYSVTYSSPYPVSAAQRRSDIVARWPAAVKLRQSANNDIASGAMIVADLIYYSLELPRDGRTVAVRFIHDIV